MTSRRDASLFLAAALVPSVATGLLGWRALRNEEAALRREAILEVAREADRVAAACRTRIEDAERSLAQLPKTVVATDDASQLDAYERARALAPPFAEPIVVAPDGKLLLPRDDAPRDIAIERACEEAARSLGTPERQIAKATILASCEEARDERGRWLWPVLAIEELAAGREASLEPRLSAWLEKRATQMRPEERTVTKEEVRGLAVSTASKNSMQRALDATSPTSSGSAPIMARAVRSTAYLVALRDQPSGTALAFDGPGVAGAARVLDDGYVVGVVVTPETLERAMPAASGWAALGSGYVAHVTTGPIPSEGSAAAPVGVAWVGEGLGVRVEHANRAALAEATRSSERVLVALIAAGIAVALAFAWLLYRRMRITRQTSELRTSFVAGVSHELRTPLASMRMLSELLAEGRVEEEERAEVVDALAKEARRMGETVERLLSYAKSERGKLVATKSRIDISEVVGERVAAFLDRNPDTKVEVVYPEALEAWADRPQIEVVVDNLLENAKKYAPEGGPYRVLLERADGEVRLSVSDRGPGIPKKFHKRIFEAFERGDDRLSKATSGTGLGLFIVRTIARAHGGDVDIDSEPGRGTTVIVSLPADGPSAKLGST